MTISGFMGFNNISKLVSKSLDSQGIVWHTMNVPANEGRKTKNNPHCQLELRDELTARAKRSTKDQRKDTSNGYSNQCILPAARNGVCRD